MLQLVTVWHAGIASHDVLPPAAKRTELTREALADVSEGLDATVVGLEGRAGPLLVEQARDSAMLVVGSAGHVGALGAMSGSVSRYCLRHAASPVAVVGPGTQPGSAWRRASRLVGSGAPIWVSCGVSSSTAPGRTTMVSE